MTDRRTKLLVGATLATKIGWDQFFDNDSSDESDGESRNQQPKNINYFENTLCFLNKLQFKAHFRMLPSTFKILYQFIASIESKFREVARSHPRLSLEKQILMTVWYLANTECFR